MKRGKEAIGPSDTLKARKDGDHRPRLHTCVGPAGPQAAWCSVPREENPPGPQRIPLPGGCLWAVIFHCTHLWAAVQSHVGVWAAWVSTSSSSQGE